jgi:hypothetical protein
MNEHRKQDPQAHTYSLGELFFPEPRLMPFLAVPDTYMHEHKTRSTHAHKYSLVAGELVFPEPRLMPFLAVPDALLPFD